MTLRPITNDEQHEAALRRIEELWNAAPGSEEENELAVLGILVNAYEADRYPISAPDPVEAIKAHMDMNGFGQSDLAGVLGSRSRASEIINRKRPLTLEMIQKISSAWNLPADLLVKPYELTAA